MGMSKPMQAALNRLLGQIGYERNFDARGIPCVEIDQLRVNDLPLTDTEKELLGRLGLLYGDLDDLSSEEVPK